MREQVGVDPSLQESGWGQDEMKLLAASTDLSVFTDLHFPFHVPLTPRPLDTQVGNPRPVPLLPWGTGKLPNAQLLWNCRYTTRIVK